MDFTFICDTKAKDFWILTMTNMYRSIAGVCNGVFTIAMIALTIRFFHTASSFELLLMTFGCILFPIVQPLVIYRKALYQVSHLPEYMELTFSKQGMGVTCKQEHEMIHWEKIVQIVENSQMIILMVGKGRGYILTNRVLGKDRERFSMYVKSEIDASRRG